MPMVRSATLCLAAWLVGLACFSGEAAQVASEQTGKCTDILVKDYESGSSDVLTTLSLLEIENRDEFEQRSKNAGAGGEFVYDGLPFKGNATWSDFQASKANYYRLHRVDYLNAQRMTWLRQKTSDGAFDAYVRCIERVREIGAYAYFHFAPDSYLKGVLHIDFYPGDTRPYTLVITTSSGTIEGFLRPEDAAGVEVQTLVAKKALVLRNLKGDKHLSFIYQRSSAKSSDLIIVGGPSALYGDSVEVLKEPTVENYEAVDEQAIETAHLSPLYNERSYDRGELCLGDKLPSVVQDWKIELTTIKPEMKGCEGVCKPAMWPTLLTEKNVCYGYKNEGPDSGGAVNFILSARAKRFDWKVAKRGG